MKSTDDPARTRYLELCQQMIEHAQLARNYAMKPGNAWLARGEIQKIAGLVSELESQLEEIKAADANKDSGS